MGVWHGCRAANGEEVMIRIVTSITVASGGLAAAAYAAMGVAAADPDATTVSLTDPFGVTVDSGPDFTYQTGNATESIAYGNETINFDSANFAPSVEQFFTSNVTVDGQPLNLTTNPLIDNTVPAGNTVVADIIDKVKPDGETEQQILLPAIQGTNIESGVIDLHNWGDGYGYDYIDLVGPGSSALNSNGVDQAIATFLITPMGTYDVSSWEDGGDYGDLAYQESQLFNLSNQLPDPFGSLSGTPDVTYQTGDVFANTAYGSQTFDFDPSSSASSIDQFLANNVTVNGEPFNVSTNPLNDVVQANVIDNTEFNGLFNGMAEQQILLPSIENTNIDNGVIDIINYGNGYSYDYIDLVGPGSQLGSNGLDNAVAAWMVTPMGTFEVMPWQGLESALFDASAFDPAAVFPELGLALPFNFVF
jgi:hypothetical protein